MNSNYNLPPGTSIRDIDGDDEKRIFYVEVTLRKEIIARNADEAIKEAESNLPLEEIFNTEVLDVWDIQQ